MSKVINQNEVIKEYITDLTTLVNKIFNDNAVAKDYVDLESYFGVVGLEKETTERLFRDCNFNSWAEFMSERSKPEHLQNTTDVKCTLGKIKGMYEAVVLHLECRLEKQINC